MRNVPTALGTHVAGEVTTLARCWKVTLRGVGSPTDVRCFTDHDIDLEVDGLTYLSTTGFTASDVDTASALNVDTQELSGAAVLPSIVKNDLLAGVWDYASIEVFTVNWASPTDGVVRHPGGHIGEITLEGNQFRAEQRGIMQYYTATIVENVSPTCRANLGDQRCGVDLAPFTVTGAVTSISADNATIGDSSRSEPGPTGGAAILSITQANPGHVTMASSLNLVDGAPVTISGVTDMVAVNGTTLFRSPNAAKTEFDLGVDTTAYPAYTPDSPPATVSPLGGTSGYFDRGLITFTSGANSGLSMEVKSYTTGQIVLVRPMPYAIQVGDTYILVAGCDKTFPTCRDRFANWVRFRGEYYVPGLDSIMQVGRHEA